jgi:hypothetical protein
MTAGDLFVVIIDDSGPILPVLTWWVNAWQKDGYRPFCAVTSRKILSASSRA